MGMERRLSSCSIKADRASEAVQIAAEQGWHRVMFSDVIGKSVALHHVACSSKGDAPMVMHRSDTAMAQPILPWQSRITRSGGWTCSA